MNSRVIVHMDMDAFFAAIEQRDSPHLRNKPVVVGADPQQGKGRGVVSTCSYEARRFGIHSAMPISIAYRKCPKAFFLPVDGKKYQKVSREIFTILQNFTPEIEPVSVDEAFLDITGSYHFYKTPYETCQRIKQKIRDEVNLTASIGIAPVKMVAKMASDVSKPDGLLEIKEENLLSFLWSQPIDRLWGVGPKNKIFFHKLNIKTIGELAQSSKDFLNENFGEQGLWFWDLAHGIDPGRVSTDHEVKSISHEHTFDIDTESREDICNVLLFLSEKISRRLRKMDLKGKTLTLKIRLQGFKTYSRAYTFCERTNFFDTLYKKGKELFDEFYSEGMKIRLIGMRITNFTDDYIQESLFTSLTDIKKENVHKALDRIKDRFGEGSIHWGQTASTAPTHW